MRHAWIANNASLYMRPDCCTTRLVRLNFSKELAVIRPPVCTSLTTCATQPKHRKAKLNGTTRRSVDTLATLRLVWSLFSALVCSVAKSACKPSPTSTLLEETTLHLSIGSRSTSTQAYPTHTFYTLNLQITRKLNPGHASSHCFVPAISRIFACGAKTRCCMTTCGLLSIAALLLFKNLTFRARKREGRQCPQLWSQSNPANSAVSGRIRPGQQHHIKWRHQCHLNHLLHCVHSFARMVYQMRVRY